MWSEPSATSMLQPVDGNIKALAIDISGYKEVSDAMRVWSALFSTPKSELSIYYIWLSLDSPRVSCYVGVPVLVMGVNVTSDYAVRHS